MKIKVIGTEAEHLWFMKLLPIHSKRPKNPEKNPVSGLYTVYYQINAPPPEKTCNNRQKVL